MVDSNVNKTAEIIAFPAADTREPLERLYDDHVEYLTNMAFRLLGADDDVEDIVQTTFVIAIERRHTLQKPESIRFWLAGITINLCRRNLRKRNLLAKFGFRSLEETTPIASPVDLDQSLLLRQLDRALDKLPANERIAWVLRHVEEEDFASVAALADCSVSTAKRRVASATTKLKRWLDE